MLPATMRATNGLPSNFERLEIRDALLRELPGLLDEVILYTGCFGGAEGLDPIDGPCSDGNLGSSPAAPASVGALRRGRRDRGVHVDILEMHRNETAGILHEILGADQASRDRRHLKLKLDQFGIK